METIIKAKCWFDNRWVRFNLTTGTYTNIMVFLNQMKLSFYADMPINFETLPKELHGKGTSVSLVDYLAKNEGDDYLILNFLIYFLNNLVDIRYTNGKKLNFSFVSGPEWQGLQLVVGDEVVIWISLDSRLYSYDDTILSCDMISI